MIPIKVVKKQLLQHGNKIREHLRYKHLNPCQQADYKKGLIDLYPVPRNFFDVLFE